MANFFLPLPIACPVCGASVTVNNKRQITEHKKNGATCYGSFMPDREPKFLEAPKTTTSTNTWQSTYGNNDQWIAGDHNHSSMSWDHLSSTQD